jgi:hypothetical protein
MTQEQPDDDDLVECADCGAAIASTDLSYAFGEDGVLCFECALRRGGHYDGPEDRWTVAPDIAGLPVEGSVAG